MFDRYIKINEKRIIAGQTSSGIWYCKELIAEDTIELKTVINDVNIILNEFNNETKKEPVISKDKKVKGLD
jgi:hypothetical protein